MVEGTTDVTGMLRRMTAKQLQAWVHFAEIEPFTFDRELRADYRAASIVQVIANVNRGKGQRPYKIDDFVIRFDDDYKPTRKQTWQEQQKIAYLIAAAYNAEGVTT
jgi:NAD-dependent DNA ligase